MNIAIVDDDVDFSSELQQYVKSLLKDCTLGMRLIL